MHATLHKLAAWLVLSACVLAGLSPARQLVLCLEQGGRVVLESATPEGCAPCESHEPSADEGAHASGVAESGCGPCVDFLLPSQSEDEPNRPRCATDPAQHTALALAPAVSGAALRVPQAELARRARGVPRSAPSLVSIRTTVLRV